jgi:hypothetical protein
VPIKHMRWLPALLLAAAGSVGANSSYAASTPLVTSATAPQPKLICKTGSIVFQSGRVKATGGCKFKNRPVGTWAWVNQTVDATGTACPSAATSGRGSSFEPKPAARVTPVFTLTVPKTRFYRTKVLRVGGNRSLTVGWDSCGVPLESAGQLTDGSKLCRYVTEHSFDLATRLLRLGKVACPVEYGECRWQPDGKLRKPAVEVTIYGGVMKCSNGYSALSYAWLNSGCVRINATAAFVIPAHWSGHAYWDITLLTMDGSDKPLPVNEIPPGEWGHGSPSQNGFASWRRIGPFRLAGTTPFC